MKIKTSELTGKALDWAVGRADGCDLAPVEYSSRWQFGGTIIEREWISLTTANDVWEALIADDVADGYHSAFGATPLVAAMRCFVASKLGDEVDLPEGV